MKWTILKLFCFCFLFPNMVCAQNQVGIILSGYEEDCEVTHKGKVYECEDRKALYMGDTVKKKPSVKSLKIKWAPYVRGAERGQTYLEVVASKPDTLKGGTLTSAVKQYVSDFVKIPTYGTTAAVTRDPKGRFPSFATLLHDYPLKIVKSEEDRFAIVVDSQRKKVWETQVKGGSELLISQKEIQMSPGEQYTLTITGSTLKRALTITVIDETLRNEVTKGLADMESEKASPLDAIIQKVAYCQLVSDVYPDKLDLYWLGNQLLEENTMEPSEDQRAIIERLKQRYLNHLHKTE
jgi:hypothetical protein